MNKRGAILWLTKEQLIQSLKHSLYFVAPNVPHDAELAISWVAHKDAFCVRITHSSLPEVPQATHYPEFIAQPCSKSSDTSSDLGWIARQS